MNEQMDEWTSQPKQWTWACAAIIRRREKENEKKKIPNDVYIVIFFSVCCNFCIIPLATSHSMFAFKHSILHFLPYGCDVVDNNNYNNDGIDDDNNGNNEINKEKPHPMTVFSSSLYVNVCLHQKRYVCTWDKDKHVCWTENSHHTSFVLTSPHVWSHIHLFCV